LRISFSKYSAFVKNHERFRLYYILGLTPEGDDTPTRMNMGRRRGSCFHAMAEGIPRPELVTKYGEDIVQRCEDMRSVVPELGELFFCEQEFDVPILDGKHSIHGFIDNGYTNADGNETIGDFKTTKGNRTKKEVNEYLGDLETSPQSHFYLKASQALGHPTELFTYHVIFDRKDKASKPKHLALDLHIGQAEVERTMAEVYAACETIEFLTNEYGPDRPWPHSNSWPCTGDRFFCGYQGLCGRTLPRGCTPPGFTQRYKDLIQLEVA
jgi:RecB family exonuclease